MEKEPVTTLEDSINHFGFGKFQMMIFFLVGVIGIADGMEMLVLG